MFGERGSTRNGVMVMACRRWFRGAVAAAAVVAVLATATFTAAGPAAADDPPTSTSDFVPLAIEGFEQTVAGPGGLVPNPDGSSLNDYIWSSAEFDGALVVGTVRGVLDLFDDDGRGDLTRFRAEIWRYEWAGNGGAEGTWTKVHESPLLAGAIPRDFGYRNMTSCGGRLYVATIGVAPRILMSNDGITFVEASRRGLPSGDLGFRGLTCLNGWLMTSPLGTTADPDIAANPVMLANRFPTFGTWQEISLPGFGNPDNLGVFATTLWDRDGDGRDDTIVAGTINRTTGAEVWVNTRPCGFFRCTGAVGSWEKLLDYGGGRPFDPPWLRNDGEWGPANAGVAWMVEFQGDIYMGMAESGFSPTGLSLAEIIVLHRDGTWNVVAGYPRAGWEGVTSPADFSAFATFGGTASSYVNLLSLGGVPQFLTVGPSEAIPYPLVGNSCDPDVDPDNPDCLPTSDRGPGMLPFSDPGGPPPFFATGAYDGTIAGLYGLFLGTFGVDLGTPPTSGDGWDAIHPLARSIVMIELILDQQIANYIWQLEAHEDRLYVTSLDTFVGDGFEMYSTTGGTSPTWDVVFTDGLGTGANYGGRSLLSTDYGLVVGTANPFGGEGPRGGAEVWLGTCAVDSPPLADAGPDQQFPDETQGAPVSFDLAGSASDGFCGSVETTTWYEGDCAGSLDTTVATDLEPTGLERTAGDPVASYDFALVVTDDESNTTCDDMTVAIGTASLPTVTIDGIAGGSGCGLEAFTGGQIPAQCDDGLPEFADSDLDNVVATTLTAVCEDGDGGAIACVFDETDPNTEIAATSGTPVDSADIVIDNVATAQPRPVITVTTTDPVTGFTASTSLQIDTDRVNAELGVVAEMTGTSVRSGLFRWRGQVSVLIEDRDGTPVSGVEVTVVQDGLFQTVDATVCTTGFDGRCSVVVGPFLGSTASFTVGDLTLPGSAGFHLDGIDDTVILERPPGLSGLFS
ncbi:MAG: hypothetical protein RIE08_03935 [Acidimicrobiales bacterium]